MHEYSVYTLLLRPTTIELKTRPPNKKHGPKEPQRHPQPHTPQKKKKNVDWINPRVPSQDIWSHVKRKSLGTRGGLKEQPGEVNRTAQQLAAQNAGFDRPVKKGLRLSLIHISEPTRLA